VPVLTFTTACAAELRHGVVLVPVVDDGPVVGREGHERVAARSHRSMNWTARRKKGSATAVVRGPGPMT
jgi:hypothetical protein